MAEDMITGGRGVRWSPGLFNTDLITITIKNHFKYFYRFKDFGSGKLELSLKRVPTEVFPA